MRNAIKVICTTLLLSAASTTFAATASAQATNYPTGPVELIVPFAPGGITDVIARMLAERMGTSLGVPVVVENRPGASTAIGMQAAARSKPDGYTLVLASSTGLVINPQMMRVSYDPVEDFEPIGLVNNMTALMLVGPDFPAQDFQGLIELAKQKPGELSYGHWGPGSPGALCMQMISAAAGVELNGITYQGANPVTVDMLGGHLQIGFTDPASALSSVGEGRLRPIASCAGKATAFPDVPTFADLGLDYEFYVRTVLLAPAGLDADVSEKLHAAFEQALDDPALLARLADIGATPPSPAPSPDELKSTIKADIAAFAQMMDSGAIKLPAQ